MIWVLGFRRVTFALISFHLVWDTACLLKIGEGRGETIWEGCVAMVSKEVSKVVNKGNTATTKARKS